MLLRFAVPSLDSPYVFVVDDQRAVTITDFLFNVHYPPKYTTLTLIFIIQFSLLAAI